MVVIIVIASLLCINILLCIILISKDPYTVSKFLYAKTFAKIQREHRAILREQERQYKKHERQFITQQKEAEIRAKKEEAGVHLAAFHKPTTSSYQVKSTYIENELSRVDRMDGHSFEIWCADLLDKIGYTDVQITPGSGDQGVDIICERNGKKYAIQCKCYHSDLGNKPIQEVTAGRIFYDCDYGIVMTNMHFTQGAIELANKVGISLCDRDTLINMLSEYVAINLQES